ncbi:MAG: glycosyltransferase family 4 protein [Candidatus Neomarinimicrobiota bacterium]
MNTREFKLKREVKINNHKVRFLSVARLHWKKGIEYTLQSLSILKKRGLSFDYIIVGGGLEYERLVYTVNQLRLNDEIKFIGSIKHKNIKEYYEKADIYLQYSIQEGFCNSVLESQAMGLITIVSDAEGLSENIIDNKTGWIVKKRSPELLAEKIEYVLSLPNKKINEIQKNAILRTQTQFDLKIQKEKFVDFYKI